MELPFWKGLQMKNKPTKKKKIKQGQNMTGVLFYKGGWAGKTSVRRLHLSKELNEVREPAK